MTRDAGWPWNHVDLILAVVGGSSAIMQALLSGYFDDDRVRSFSAHEEPGDTILP
jgi:hypothetical protein